MIWLDWCTMWSIHCVRYHLVQFAVCHHPNVLCARAVVCNTVGLAEASAAVFLLRRVVTPTQDSTWSGCCACMDGAAGGLHLPFVPCMHMWTCNNTADLLIRACGLIAAASRASPLSSVFIATCARVHGFHMSSISMIGCCMVISALG